MAAGSTAVRGRSRSESLRTARAAELASWFRDRRWRVMTEVSGTATLPESECTITYDHGEFWIGNPYLFRTPLGHNGRHGFLLRELDPQTGADTSQISMASFGHDVLVKAQERFGAITGELPAPRRHPPAEVV
jgi:hypothetical protein